MKKLTFLFIMLIAAWACSQSKEISTVQGKSPTLAMDSTEYMISIDDQGFEQWYLMNYSPAADRSNAYYRSQNRLGVSNWNQYFIRNKHSRVVGSDINYNPAEDYGIEVERRLYWYFKYIEENYQVRLFR